jgi:hypothetical protein
MKTVLIGMLLGSLVTSEHDTREACEGRKTLLAEKGVVGLQCVAPKGTDTITLGSGGANSYTLGFETCVLSGGRRC